MTTEEDAKRAISQLNGTVHLGRAIIVSELARETKGGGGRDRDRGDRDRWGG